MQGINSFRQTINHMIFFGTGPFFHDISVFVDHLKFCSLHLFSGSRICLGDPCLGRLILNFFTQYNLFKILVFVGYIYFPYFLVRKISGFSDFLFDIIFPMWKVTVKGQISVLVGCFLFQQGILLYKNFSLIRDDIFPGIQSEDDSFQFFSCNRILLFYRYGHFLSLVFVGNPFINNCLRIILGCQGKFFLLGIQDKILSCHNFFQIISSQWQVVEYCHSLFVCSQFGYQIIFFVADKRIPFFVLCSVR